MIVGFIALFVFVSLIVADVEWTAWREPADGAQHRARWIAMRDCIYRMAWFVRIERRCVLANRIMHMVGWRDPVWPTTKWRPLPWLC